MQYLSRQTSCEPLLRQITEQEAWLYCNWLPQQNEINQDRNWTGQLNWRVKFTRNKSQEVNPKAKETGGGVQGNNKIRVLGLSKAGESANPEEVRVCPGWETGCGDSVGLNPRNRQPWHSGHTHWLSQYKVHSVSCSLSHILPLFVNLLTWQSQWTDSPHAWWTGLHLSSYSSSH